MVSYFKRFAPLSTHREKVIFVRINEYFDILSGGIMIS